jgi:integrase
MVIVHGVPALVEKLKGSRLQMLATVSLFTGMRLGEVLALRWSRVELDTKVIQVREALEETAEHGIRFKAPKSKAGRRDIVLIPPSLISFTNFNLLFHLLPSFPSPLPIVGDHFGDHFIFVLRMFV